MLIKPQPVGFDSFHKLIEQWGADFHTITLIGVPGHAG